MLTLFSCLSRYAVNKIFLIFFFFFMYSSFFKNMLNVDKKPLCGARKQRWLVSVAWKRKKKNPSNGSYPTTTKIKNNDDDDKKKSKQFFKKEIFSQFSWLFFSPYCDVTLLRVTLCVFEGNFFSLTQSCVCICWKMKYKRRKKSWENKNTRESDDKKFKNERNLVQTFFFLKSEVCTLVTSHIGKHYEILLLGIQFSILC